MNENRYNSENVNPMRNQKPIIRTNPVPAGLRPVLGEISNRSSSRVNPATRKPFQPVGASKQQAFSIFVDPSAAETSLRSQNQKSSYPKITCDASNNQQQESNRLLPSTNFPPADASGERYDTENIPPFMAELAKRNMNIAVPKQPVIPLSWKSRLGDLSFAVFCDQDQQSASDRFTNEPPCSSASQADLTALEASTSTTLTNLVRSKTVPVSLNEAHHNEENIQMDEDSSDQPPKRRPLRDLEVSLAPRKKSMSHNESVDNIEFHRSKSIQEDEDIESESMAMDSSCQQDSSAMEEEEEEELEESCSSEILETSAMILAREELAFCLDMDEYKDDIYSHLTSCQSKVVPKWNYMTKQPDITFSMRSILVDWLVEVGEEYKLHNETVYLAVNYIDRFLSFMSVQRAKLQLVGAACMFIASKYEEIYPPDVGEFVYITDDTYSKKQVLRMEHLVLKVLNFDLAVPTTYMFVTVFAKEAQTDDRTTFLAMYLCELTLLDAKTYLPFPSNVIAAASLALARHTCGIAAWPESVAQMSGVSVEDFKECLVQLHSTYTNAGGLAQQAIREKYKTSKYMAVADIKPTPIC